MYVVKFGFMLVRYGYYMLCNYLSFFYVSFLLIVIMLFEIFIACFYFWIIYDKLIF